MEGQMEENPPDARVLGELRRDCIHRNRSICRSFRVLPDDGKRHGRAKKLLFLNCVRNPEARPPKTEMQMDGVPHIFP